MAELKTKENDQSVNEFINSLTDEKQRNDSEMLIKIMSELSSSPPKMWGDSIIGFGQYRYKYASGREGDWFLVGFSPRKANISLYIISYLENFNELMMQLGKYKTGKSCIYIKKIEDINLDILKELISISIAELKKSETA
jgi:hypothetical protein